MGVFSVMPFDFDIKIKQNIKLSEPLIVSVSYDKIRSIHIYIVYNTM
jgi:hypothetical protein